jgi:DNA-binding XRE family transcriptional regulator
MFRSAARASCDRPSVLTEVRPTASTDDRALVVLPCLRDWSLAAKHLLSDASRNLRVRGKSWLVENYRRDPRAAKPPHQRSEYLKHHRVGTGASYLPFETTRAASSAGRDLMERSSMEHLRWQKSLRQLRLRAGLTEQALAGRLGVTCHAIQAWERGQRAVRKGWEFKLAEALGCSVTDLHQAKSVGRSERWHRAWVNLADAPKTAGTRQWDAKN